MGLWPGVAPTGYLNEKRMDRKGQVIIDPERGHVIKKAFEKVAYEKWSGKKVYNWLKFELNYKTATGNKNISLGNIYTILQNTFYYGVFEYPQKSGNWYTGKHEPLITKELFDMVQEQVKSQYVRSENKELAFTKLMTCGNYGSGITADEKFKRQKNGNVHRYVYYICSKSKDRDCKEGSIEEKELIRQFEGLIDEINLDEIEIKGRIKEEIERFKKFQSIVSETEKHLPYKNIDIKNYAKYTLKYAHDIEKREMMSCIKSKILIKVKFAYIDKIDIQINI